MVFLDTKMPLKSTFKAELMVSSSITATSQSVTEGDCKNHLFIAH